MRNQRKATFFTSDWHIGHKNVLEFSQRPFKDIDHMAEVLIRNYNSTVPEYGLCYFLGDMGLCSQESLKTVIDQLHGTKVLILGNHDKKMQAMYNLGFDVVLYGATLMIAGELVTMSHCPLIGLPRENTKGMRGGTIGENWHGESRPGRRKFSQENFGQFHLSGHIHSPNGGKSTKILHRQYDVGLDSNGYKPISMARLESWIAQTKTRESDWRDIPGFPGYKVNWYGQVKSFRRYEEGKLLKPKLHRDGYAIVVLYQEGLRKDLLVHRIVASTFIPNEENLPQVNHRNGLKFDNHVDNLEWASNLGNQRHAWDTGLKNNGLTKEQVAIIKTRLKSGHSNTEIAKDFKVMQSTISSIKTGRYWNRI